MNLMIETIESILEYKPLSDKQYINKLFIVIIKNLKIVREKLIDIRYFKNVWKLVTNLMNFASEGKKPNMEETLILKLATDRAIELTEYVVVEEFIPTLHYEIFSNNIFQIMTNDLHPACKKRIWNFFFKINGHHFLRNKIAEFENKNKTIAFKSQVLLAEFMSQVVIFLQNITNLNEQEIIKLRYLKISINSYSNDKYDSMLTVFTHYIDLKWQPWTESNQSMISTASTLNFFKDQKLMYDQGIRNFLLSSFLTCFTSVIIQKDPALASASKIVKKFNESVNLELNFNFIKWWLSEHRNSTMAYEKLILAFISQEKRNFNYKLDKNDIAVFKQFHFLMNVFLDKKNKDFIRLNILKIFSQCQLPAEELAKLVKYFQNSLTDEILSIETVNLLSTLKFNAGSLRKKHCKELVPCIHTIFQKEYKNLDTLWCS